MREQSGRPFKKAIFGGFYRSDVMSYIEDQAKALAVATQNHEEERKRLADEMKLASGQLEEKKSEAESAIRVTSSLKAELETLKIELSDSRQKETLLKTQAESLNAENEKLRVEISSERSLRAALENEIDELRAKANEFEMLKRRLYEIELGAAKRAEEVELNAAKHAEAVEREAMENVLSARSALNSLLLDAKEKYNVFKSDTDKTALLLSDELEKMKGWFGAMRTVFGEIGTRMDSLCNAERENPVVPDETDIDIYVSPEVEDTVCGYDDDSSEDEDA